MLLARRRRSRPRPPACDSRPSTASRPGCGSTSRSTSSPANCGRTASSRSSASSSGGPTSTSRDAARAIVQALEAGPSEVGGDVFNVGHSDENYRKLDLVEIITAEIAGGRVSFVHRDEDPRDYKVSFSKVRERLGFEPSMRVPDGVREVARELEAGAFDDPFAAEYRNTP